jgi:carbohydrate-selective porin OprB
VACLAVLVIPALAVTAQDSDVDVLKLLAERRRSGLVTRGFAFMGNRFGPLFDPYEAFRDQFHDETGFDVGVETKLIFQQLTSGDQPDDTTVFNLNIFGAWDLIDDEAIGKGRLGWVVRYRDPFGPTPREFSRAVGVPYTTNDTNVDDEFLTLLQFWWQQQFADDRVALTFGKIDQGAYLNGSTYAGSDGRYFLAQPLATNPSRAFPGNGLGMNLKVTPNDAWYVSAGFGDADANSRASGFNTIEGNWFSGAEIGLTPQLEGLGPGTYRFTVFHRDGNDRRQENYGFALSFDQQMSDEYALFLRYGIGNARVGAIEKTASTGIVFIQPFGFPDDALGFAAFWGQSTNGSRHSDWGLETFWRWQVTPRGEFTPGWQVHFDPSGNPDKDVVGVFTLRLRWLF